MFHKRVCHRRDACTMFLMGLALSGACVAVGAQVRNRPRETRIKATPVSTPTLMLTPGSHDQTLTTSDGVVRHYRLHIPPAYNGQKPAPLVLMLHGRGGNGKGFEKLTGMSDKADQDGFIVVYPDALGAPPAWTTGWNNTIHNADDVGFIRALIAKMEQTLKIDPRRVYCAGFSSGGFMTELLGASLSGKIAAIGVVEGAIGTIQDGQRHTVPDPGHPVSLVQFHGKQDQTVPYDGGPNPHLPDGVVFSVAQSISFWVQQDGCNTTPDKKTLDNSNVIRDTYSGGKQGTEVVLYTIQNGQHKWPDPTNAGIRATDRIWAFFKAHPKQSQGGSPSQ